jgi:hypothetical protein
MGTASLWMVSTMTGEAEAAASKDRPMGRRMAAGEWDGDGDGQTNGYR